MESTATTSFSKERYDKANEAFTNDNYVKAVEMYGEALAHDPLNVDYLCARAHAHIKMDNFEKAKTDANKAIDIALKDETGRWKISLSRAFLRSGCASFNLGRYSEAKNCFLQAQQQQDEMGIKQWITWCEEKMAKLGIKQDEGSGESVATVKEPAKEQIKSKIEEQPKTMSNTEQEKVKVAKEEDKPLEADKKIVHVDMPTPKIKHDWYQTETQVVIEVRIKGLKQEQVKVDFGSTSLSVTAKLPNSATSTSSDYSLELDLAQPVIAEQCTYKVLSTKLEIKLKKQDGIRWTQLEGDGITPAVSSIPAAILNPSQQPSSVKPPPYPSAKGKNWDRIAVDIEKELENEKPEGEAALNDMFQKIYANADENTKRAMNKSFQESGGTVLSTNWQDIGKEQTEVKPPDGMEWKKWDS